MLRACSRRSKDAPPVIAKIAKKGTEPDPLYGLFAAPASANTKNKSAVVSFEADTELRDTEQVPLLEPAVDGTGIESFVRREVLPYAPDAWIDATKTKVGYEVSFTRHFYKPKPLRGLDEIAADIRAAEDEAEAMLEGLIEEGAREAAE